MFFSVTANVDIRFPINHKIPLGYLNVDEGWKQTTVNNNTVFYKGYCEGSSLQNTVTELVSDPEPRHQGNFAAIIVSQDCCTITHDVNRGFPLYYAPHIATNLVNESFDGCCLTRIYADRYLTINRDWKIDAIWFDCCGSINLSPLTLEQCVDSLKELLLTKFKNTAIEVNKLKLFPTGGVDTLLMSAIIQSQNTKVELIDYEHFDYDKFTYTNKTTLKTNYWGYSQLHHWKEECMLVTGGSGDESFFRGPTTIALWAAWHGINVVDLLGVSAEKYHTKYFSKPATRAVFSVAWDNRLEIRRTYPTEQDLIKQIINVNVNDHQYWHLGHTLTLTLFKDIEITKLILRLPKDIILDQILDAAVSKALIRAFSPELLNRLAQSKNYNSMAILGHYV